MNDLGAKVKEAFSGKQGKVLLIGGGLAVVAYVWWSRSSDNTTAEPVDDLAPTSSGTNTSAQSDPTVGNSTSGDTGSRPTTNPAWLADATDYLEGRGVSAGNAYSALSKALYGESLTTAERAWVSQAIAGVGTPPEGMPPLVSAPASTTPSTTTPSTTTPKPATAKPAAGSKSGYGWYRVVKGDSVSGIAKKTNTTVANLYLYNPGGLNRLTIGEWLKTRWASNPIAGYKGK